MGTSAFYPGALHVDHEYVVCNMCINTCVKVQSIFMALFLDSVNPLAAQVSLISLNISFLLLVDFL